MFQILTHFNTLKYNSKEDCKILSYMGKNRRNEQGLMWSPRAGNSKKPLPPMGLREKRGRLIINTYRK